VSIWLDSETAKKQFDLLFRNRATIEAEFSEEDLSWERKDNKIASCVFVGRPYDREKASDATPEREVLFSWIAKTLTKFRDIAKKYLVEGQPV
jgi:hypothetical protein